MKTNDEFDRGMKIIRFLWDNPEATRQKIAKATEIPEPTVQRRLKQLKDSGIISTRTELASENIFFPTRALIGIDVSSAELKSKDYGYHNQQEFVSFLHWGAVRRKEFAKVMSNVLIKQVEIVLGGPSDLIVILSAASPRALAAYVTIVLRKLPGVLKTNTSTLVSYDKPKGVFHQATQFD